MSTPNSTFVRRTQNDIRKDIAEVDTLLKTGVIETRWPDEVFWPVVTRLVICIRDLVAKSANAKIAGKPVDFTDDVIVEGRVKDVSSLIKFMRDALCHVESGDHMMDETNYSSFHVVSGKSKGMKIPGYEFSCDYDDDIAFIFGRQRIYLSRHLLRASREAVANLQDFLKKDFKNPT